MKKLLTLSLIALAFAALSSNIFGRQSDANFLRNDLRMLQEARYKIYGAREIYTPLDRVVERVAIFCNLVEYRVKNIAWQDPRIQDCISQLKPQDIAIDNRSFPNIRAIMGFFYRDYEILRGYRDDASNAQTIKLLDRILNDVEILYAITR